MVKCDIATSTIWYCKADEIYVRNVQTESILVKPLLHPWNTEEWHGGVKHVAADSAYFEGDIFLSPRPGRAHSGGSVRQPAEAAPQPHGVHGVSAAGAGESLPADTVPRCGHEREAGRLHQPAWGSHTGESRRRPAPDCKQCCMRELVIYGKYLAGKHDKTLLCLTFDIKVSDI